VAAEASPPSGSGGQEVLRVLFVCTGNICRSAVAERLARRMVAERSGDQALRMVVDSAGTHGVKGSAIHPASAAALRELGGDDTGFTARRLTAAMVREADLVLTMTRDHRRLVLELDPRALSRTFTLREAAVLGRLGEPERESPPAGPPGERIRATVARLATARSRHVGGSADDIEDPIGQPSSVHAETAEEIRTAVATVLDVLTGADAVPSAAAEGGLPDGS
jgi:protein-tyrosine phosphatase